MNDIPMKVEGASPAPVRRDAASSESIAELAGALVQAQAAIRAARKDAKNPHFGSKYATLAEVWDVIRDPLTTNGLAVMQLPLPIQDDVIAVRTMLVHKSGEWVASSITMPLRPEYTKGGTELPPSPQQVGSCITYARRYALSAMVGVAADDDDDGNLASREPRNEPAPVKQPPEIAPGSTLKNEWKSAYPGEPGSDGKPSDAPVQAAKPAQAAKPDPAPGAAPAGRGQDRMAFHARLYQACEQAGVTAAQLESDLKAKGILKGQMSLDNLGEPIVNALLDGRDKNSGRANWDIVVERIKTQKG